MKSQKIELQRDLKIFYGLFFCLFLCLFTKATVESVWIKEVQEGEAQILVTGFSPSEMAGGLDVKWLMSSEEIRKQIMEVQMENFVLNKFQLCLTLLQLFSHFELFLGKWLFISENKKFAVWKQGPSDLRGSGFPLWSRELCVITSVRFLPLLLTLLLLLLFNENVRHFDWYFVSHRVESGGPSISVLG